MEENRKKRLWQDIGSRVSEEPLPKRPKMNYIESWKEFLSPRIRQRSPLSEGSSESSNPNIFYRALRVDEKPEQGLAPPDGYDETKTIVDHITAGSRAKIKSRFISATRSIKVAAAWSVNNSKQGRVVKIVLPEQQDYIIYDLTSKGTEERIFKETGGRIGAMALNSAKSSQEVIIDPKQILRDNEATISDLKIPVSWISEVYSTYKIDKKDDYNKAIANGIKCVRTRTKVKEPHIRIKLLPKSGSIQEVSLTNEEMEEITEAYKETF